MQRCTDCCTRVSSCADPCNMSNAGLQKYIARPLATCLLELAPRPWQMASQSAQASLYSCQQCCLRGHCFRWSLAVVVQLLLMLAWHLPVACWGNLVPRDLDLDSNGTPGLAAVPLLQMHCPAWSQSRCQDPAALCCWSM